MMNQAKAGELPDIPEHVAVVVLTLNEARNLQSCLKPLPVSYTKVVIDSGSTDATVAMASALGCEVHTRAWTGFASQRNFALNTLRSRFAWALFIDADETYSPEFFSWLEKALHRELRSTEAVYLSSKLLLRDKLLKHAPGYPIYHPRLVRTDQELFRDSASGHGETIADGARMMYVDIPYTHNFLSSGMSDWLSKHLRLAEMEVASLGRITNGVAATRRSRLNQAMKPSLLRAALRFLYHYLVRAGFLDGRAGLDYSLMYFWYELTKLLSVSRS